MLRFYIEVARTAFRRQLIYRWANLAGLLTNTFFGCIFSYVMIALFQVRHSAGGYNLLDTLRYTWLIQAIAMGITTFGWYDLMLTIRSGAVISDLSKPCDFYWYWFSREMGRNCYYFLYRTVPIYLAGMLLFGLGIPGDWKRWLVFAISVTLGAMLGIAYRVLHNITAFWFLEARAIGTFATTIALFFTGSYIPLPFFPHWLLAIASWLPFNALINVPTEILLGKFPDSTLPFELGRQVLWVIILTLIVYLLTKMAARRVVVQGG